MKRLIILFLLILSSQSFALSSNIENAIDGGGRAINFSVDTRTGSTANYYSVATIVTSNKTFDVYSYLNRFASAGMLINDSTANITANVSVNGTTFGQDILVKTTEILDLSFFIIWKSIKVTVPASASIRLMAR